jgi:hypothetical protein
MIKAVDVHRYNDLATLLTEAAKRLEDLKAERNDLHEKLVNAVLARQRIQSDCAFVLAAEAKEKTFIPPYKDCAIELADEATVKEWVRTHHPHEQVYKLRLTPKAGKLRALRMNPKVAQVLDAIAKLRRAA